MVSSLSHRMHRKGIAVGMATSYGGSTCSHRGTSLFIHTKRFLFASCHCLCISPYNGVFFVFFFLHVLTCRSFVERIIARSSAGHIPNMFHLNFSSWRALLEDICTTQHPSNPHTGIALKNCEQHSWKLTKFECTTRSLHFVTRINTTEALRTIYLACLSFSISHAEDLLGCTVMYSTIVSLTCLGKGYKHWYDKQVGLYQQLQCRFGGIAWRYQYFRTPAPQFLLF